MIPGSTRVTIPIDSLALATIALSHPDAVLVVGSDGRLEAASDAALRALGCSLADISSRPLSDVLTDQPESIASYLRLCRRSREPVLGSLTFRSAPERSFSVKGARLTGLSAAQDHRVVLRIASRDEQVKAFLGLNERVDALNREIIRRQAAERDLRVSEEWLKTTLLSIGDAVIATDEQGRLRFMNEVAERLSGWTVPEARGRLLREVFRIANETTGETIQDPVEEVRASGAIVGLASHTVLFSREGRRVPIADSAAPIRDPSGKMIGVVLVLRDVSEERRVEEERRLLLERAEQARREAERANKAKDEFLAILSHELRTPLSAILGWTRLLQAGKVAPEKAAKAIAVIDRNARAQIKLVDDILDVSRIMGGTLELNSQEVSLSNVVTIALDSAQPAADAKGVALHVEVDPASVAVTGDTARLQQVVSNLLSNGIKFTPTGGEVRVKLGRLGDSMEIAVTDSGEGIEPASLAHVFERFRQEDSSTRRRHGGLGLGLAIVKSLVEGHGGTVTAESAGKGCGASFRVQLPIITLGVSPIVADARRDRIPEVSLEGLHVLLVDDEAETHHLVQAILGERGARVVSAFSVAEAMSEVAIRRPEVIISDLGMPGQDGFDLIRRLRASWKEQGTIPTLALTAFASAETRSRVLWEGFNTYMTKPVEPSELVLVVASLAGRIG